MSSSGYSTSEDGDFNGSSFKSNALKHALTNRPDELSASSSGFGAEQKPKEYQCDGCLDLTKSLADFRHVTHNSFQEIKSDIQNIKDDVERVVQDFKTVNEELKFVLKDSAARFKEEIECRLDEFQSLLISQFEKVCPQHEMGINPTTQRTGAACQKHEISSSINPERLQRSVAAVQKWLHEASEAGENTFALQEHSENDAGAQSSPEEIKEPDLAWSSTESICSSSKYSQGNELWDDRAVEPLFANCILEDRGLLKIAPKSKGHRLPILHEDPMTQPQSDVKLMKPKSARNVKLLDRCSSTFRHMKRNGRMIKHF